MKLLKNNTDQMWFNVQAMTREQRKQCIKYITSLSRTNGGFIEYNAKYLMAYLIHASECKFNNSGRSTNVPEFEKLGWYDKNGKLNFDKIMNC